MRVAEKLDWKGLKNAEGVNNENCFIAIMKNTSHKTLLCVTIGHD
jgi:hypothetical protein